MKQERQNPAVELFGDRIYAGQSSLEYLAEFLLVCGSPKRINDERHKTEGQEFITPLPPFDILGDSFYYRYAPRARLDFKLFSLLSASKLSSRVNAHIEHLVELRKELAAKLEINASRGTKDEVLDALRDLFLGFRGTGRARTWCAQTHFPICRSLLAGETIWNESKGKGELDWSTIIDKKTTYFSTSKHLFLARGGELLYYQLCDALSRPESDLAALLDTIDCSDEERKPESLHKALNAGLDVLLTHKQLDTLASFIEQGDDNETAEAMDFNTTGERRFVDTSPLHGLGSMQGYLLAIEMARALALQLDPIEKVNLLETLLCLHIIRHLCSLSAEQMRKKHGAIKLADCRLGYGLIMSPEECPSRRLSQLSHLSFKYTQQLLHDAVHSIQPPEDLDETDQKKFYKEADKSYAFAVFRKIGKSMGMVIPRTGGNERMVLTESLLRTLVLVLVKPERDLTYDTFKAQVAAHFGLVFDREGIRRTMAEIGFPCDDPGHDIDEWVLNTLENAGMLVPLSDSCSLVRNPVAALMGDNA